MKAYGHKVPCIGGPLHGCMVDADAAERIVPLPEVPGRKLWNFSDQVPAAIAAEEVLQTRYRLTEVTYDYGALTLSGSVYLWHEAEDSKAQIVLMSIVAWLAAGAPTK